MPHPPATAPIAADARPLRICVLHSSYERSSAPFAAHDPVGSLAHYAPEHSWRMEGIHKATAVAQLRALVQEGYDVFVNLCDGAWDEDRAGLEVVQILERFGQAFTGSTSSFYEPSRETMKRVCHYAGIGTPGFTFVHDAADVDRALAHLRFPMIVKHPSSYGSIGMGRDARCADSTELRAVVDRNLAAFGGALIEEFIEGREFTVLVAEPGLGESIPRTWAPLEYTFPPGESFKHFDLKWRDWQGMGTQPVTDPELAARLRADAQRFFTAIGGTGYGRCDVRMDSEGRLYTLEINPNCGIFYPEDAFGSADFILSLEPGGHRAFLLHILDCALRRQAATQPISVVSFDPVRGYELVATRDLSEGTLVQQGEERPHFLVSRRNVEQRWTPQTQRWFRQYAWPLTEGVSAMWSDRPEDWQPINHSCDPNCWLEGLDLTARRPIQKGEALTMDYATFCGPDMEPFDCACGALGCRGTVRGNDALLAEVIAAYGDHVSDYVRRWRGGG
jgi:D-alanine-D-alanine ligase-like ATP-grasp enzyme